MNLKSEIILDSKFYFSNLLDKASSDRKIKVKPAVHSYLVELLNNFLRTDNLFSGDETDSSKKSKINLGELYLKSIGAEPGTKTQRLRRLGDVSLYMSGFFGDSFKRKIIDVDYYIGMGERAYHELSVLSQRDIEASVFKNISSQFGSYVDLFTIVSQECQIQDTDDVLRIYERYFVSGSELAKDQLIEKGVMTVPRTSSTKKQ